VGVGHRIKRVPRHMGTYRIGSNASRGIRGGTASGRMCPEGEEGVEHRVKRALGKKKGGGGIESNAPCGRGEYRVIGHRTTYVGIVQNASS
jgi:hypothetical protein